MFSLDKKIKNKSYIKTMYNSKGLFNLFHLLAWKEGGQGAK